MGFFVSVWRVSTRERTNERGNSLLLHTHKKAMSRLSVVIEETDLFVGERRKPSLPERIYVWTLYLHTIGYLFRCCLVHKKDGFYARDL